MICIFVNGEAQEVDKNASLQQVLQLSADASQLDLAHLAVAFNQHILPRSRWPEQCFQQGDRVDIFSAVAGG